MDESSFPNFARHCLFIILTIMYTHSFLTWINIDHHHVSVSHRWDCWVFRWSGHETLRKPWTMHAQTRRSWLIQTRSSWRCSICLLTRPPKTWPKWREQNTKLSLPSMCIRRISLMIWWDRRCDTEIEKQKHHDSDILVDTVLVIRFLSLNKSEVVISKVIQNYDQTLYRNW